MPHEIIGMPGIEGAADTDQWSVEPGCEAAADPKPKFIVNLVGYRPS